MRLPSIALRVWNGNEIYLDFIEFASLLDIEWFVLKCMIFLLFNLVIFVFLQTQRGSRVLVKRMEEVRVRQTEGGYVGSFT